MVALALVAGHTQWSLLVGSNNLVFLARTSITWIQKLAAIDDLFLAGWPTGRGLRQFQTVGGERFYA